MVVVPEFLTRRVYKKGSFRNFENAASLQSRNVARLCLISGFNFVKINDVVFEPKDVKFITGGKELAGDCVSEAEPVAFRLGQEGLLIMSGKDCVVQGTNKIVIEVMNPEAGKVQLTVDDTV